MTLVDYDRSWLLVSQSFDLYTGYMLNFTLILLTEILQATAVIYAFVVLSVL